MHFLNTEHGRQLVLGGWTQEVKGRPGPLKGALKQELDATERDGDGAARGVAFVAQKEEILAQFVFGDLIGWFAEMEGQLANRDKVGLLGSVGQAMQLHVFEHALA